MTIFGKVKASGTEPGQVRPPLRCGRPVGEAKFVGVAGSEGVAVGKKEIMVAVSTLLDEAGEGNDVLSGAGQIELRVITVAPG